MLTCVLNGVTYLKIELPITNSTNTDKLTDRIKSHKGILQKLEAKGMFSRVCGIAHILIPEDQVISFTNSI